MQKTMGAGSDIFLKLIVSVRLIPLRKEYRTTGAEKARTLTALLIQYDG